MKQAASLIILFVFIAMLISCNKDEDHKSENLTNCIFEQNDENLDGIIDETERLIMEECLENQFSSKSSIEMNLIGEWSLIGHGEGWIHSISQPCANIKISSEELIFEFHNEFKDTITTSGWEIEEIKSSMFNYFNLKTDSENQEGLWITNFCENYMYGDATPLDGNMYLYEKIK